MKKIIKIIKNNYLIFLLLITLLFVGVVFFYRQRYAKSNLLYVKVKLNQGNWWASVNRPSIWFIESLKKQIKLDAKKSGVSQKMEAVTYYPWMNTSQFDIYVIVKLKVNPIKNSDQYSYQRSTISIGAPIDLEFSQVQFSGTIIGFQSKPFNNNLVEKDVYLVKKYVYPWEYEAIKINDKYNNGLEDIFQITDKELHDINDVGFIQQSSVQNLYVGEPRNYVVVKAKIKLKKVADKYIFGEEQIITPGQSINLATNNIYFSEYIIEKVE